MADNEIKLKIVIDGKEAIASINLTEDELKELASAMRQAGEESRNTSDSIVHSFAQARNFIQGFREAINMISSAFGSQMNAYLEQENALIKLNTALKQTGQYSKETAKELEDYAAELQRTTVYGDEVTETVMAQLVAMGLNKRQVKEATLQAANLATVMGTDLSSAARAMADLFQGNTGMIGRYVKGLDETIIKSGDLDAIIRMLNERIGGQAVAMGNSSAGAIAKMNNAIGDLRENAGESISKALSPLIRLTGDLVAGLNELSPRLSGIIGIVTTLTGVFVTLRLTGIIPATTSIELFGIALTGLKAAMVKTGIGALVVALSYAFYELVKAYDKWQDNIDAKEDSFKKAVDQLKEGAAGLDDKALKKFIETAGQQKDKLKDHLNELNDQYDNALDKRINKDKEGYEYTLKYENDKSRVIEEQIDQQKYQIRLKEAEIKAYKELEEERKKPKIEPKQEVTFEQSRAELEETQRHAQEMLKIWSDSDGLMYLLKLKHFDQMLRLYKKFGEDTTKLEHLRAEAEARARAELSDAEIRGMKKNDIFIKDYQMESYAGMNELEEQHQEDIIALSEPTVGEKLNLLDEDKENIARTLGQAAGMFAEHTAAYQAFAKAQALIDTYTSAQMAFKSLAGIPVVGPVLGAAAAVAAIIAGLQRVEQIGKVQVPRTRGYAAGGRFLKGDKGFIEGYENEIIAPEKTFVEVFKQELRPKIYDSEGGRLGLIMEKYLERIEQWSNSIKLEAAIKHTEIHLSNERGREAIASSML